MKRSEIKESPILFSLEYNMDIKQFLTNISTEDLILTANRRLSIYLQNSYDKWQVEQGKKAWLNLTILPFSTWIEQIWIAFSQDARLLLNDFQEQILWETVISDSEAGNSLLHPSATAHLVKNSWRLLNNWLLPIEQLSSSQSLDVQTFLSWVKSFKEICETKSYVTRSETLPLLIKQLQNERLKFKLPDRIFFIGFDELSPGVKLLQNCLKPSQVKNIDFTQTTRSSVNRVSFSNQKEEFQEMARWAFRNLKENSNALIGCVIPTLTDKRNQITQIFNDVFYAEEWQKEFGEPPFNISAANNLGQYAIIHAALKIIALNQHANDLHDISSLLLTPFLGGAETELNLRSQLDAKLRRNNETKITLLGIINQAASCPILETNLLNFQKQNADSRRKFSLSHWSILFANQLSLLGWPGQRSLNSVEFQLVERFKKILDEMVALAEFVGEVDFQKAFFLLQQLISSTLFQPKTTAQPIQILGILEASGIQFDYLWVAGLDDETWPAAASPNPFIPFDLQKKLAMPHATSERELQFSLNITKRFITNTNNLIFSYAEFDEDRPLAPSPLITSYPLLNTKIPTFVRLEKIIFNSKNLEYFVDDYGPPISEDQATGGSYLFKAQAACPFQAFALFRLHAEPLNDLQIGLASYERGSLVHDILATVWQQIATHEKLCSLTENAINDLITEATDSALSRLSDKKPMTLTQRLLNLESTRLKKLIYSWLQLEKLRQPFEIVSCEQRKKAQIGRLAVNIQIDRIDKLRDGSELIIDYKTGKPSILDWFSERPNEPQLPLYTVLSDQLLSGVLFAQVRADDMNFKGLIVYNDIVPGAVTLDKLKTQDFQNFNSLIDYWQKILCQLAEDFYQGRAEVSPKDATTCQYCELQAFCRINELKKC